MSLQSIIPPNERTPIFKDECALTFHTSVSTTSFGCSICLSLCNSVLVAGKRWWSVRMHENICFLFPACTRCVLF